MRLLTTAAVALVLAAGGGAALAQPQGNDENGQKGHPAAAPHGGGQPGGGHPAPHGGGHGGPAQGGAGPSFHPEVAPSGGGRVGGTAGPSTTHRTFQAGGQGAPTNVTGQMAGPRTTTAGARAGGLQFHRHALRAADQGRNYYRPGAFAQRAVAPQRFHVTTWRRPSGWYYRSWSYGMYLPFGWFLPAYYLNWALYDLPPPPIGCEWVREGPDAVLVDIWTGEILSVYSGVFY